MKYIVRYEATYYVDADNEADAVKLGIFFHEQNPDGTWEAVRDPYESRLSSLADGTYTVLDGNAYLVSRQTGYWVGTEAVQALSDVPQDGFLGVWTDPAGERYYDLARHIEDLTEALSVASYYDQQSIWDIAEEREIPVNV